MYPQIDHQLDVWHCSKNLTKKLTAKAKTKGCEALLEWIRAVSNHLWYASATCKNNMQLLKWVHLHSIGSDCMQLSNLARERWLSILFHITGIHSWTGGKKTNKCNHGPSEVAHGQEVAYLNKKSPAFKALKEIVEAPALIKLLPKLTKFCHTGNLEVLQSHLLRFCSKRQYFPYPGNIPYCIEIL